MDEGGNDGDCLLGRHKRFNPTEFPINFDAMKIRLGSVLYVLVIAVVVDTWGCGESNDESQTQEKAYVIEPLIGVDTTKPLITLEEEAAMRKLLLIPYKEDGLWGFTDSSGTVVIPPKYEEASAFLENGLTVVKTGTGFGLLNKNGVEVVKPILPNRILDCGCGVYGFEQTNGFALVNKQGKRIDKGQVEKVMTDCHEDRLAVKQDGRWGFLDSRGQAMIAADMDQVFPFYHGIAPVRKSGQKAWMLIDRSGKAIGQDRFEVMYPLQEGFGVGIQTDPVGRSKYGVIDSTGKVIVPFQFARIAGTFTGDFVACAAYDPYDLESKGITEEANTWFIYNRQGNKVGETHYGLWDEFSEGLIVAQKGEKFGFVDSTGRLAIPFDFEWACAFKNGLAWVQKKDRYGFIDKSGKTVIPFKYGSAYDYVFMEAHGAPVLDPETGERFFVDRNGKEYRKKP